LLIYSGNFPLSSDKDWQHHLLDDCGCSPSWVMKVETLVNYYKYSDWYIFWEGGKPYLEEIKR
jgi:hypothetical protein